MKHKTQDKKFYIEDNRLVGQSGPVPDDEPLFILRARDVNAIPTLRQYFQIASRNSASQHVRAITEAIERFQTFKESNPDRIKVPDTDLTMLHDGKP